MHKLLLDSSTNSPGNNGFCIENCATSKDTTHDSRQIASKFIQNIAIDIKTTRPHVFPKTKLLGGDCFGWPVGVKPLDSLIFI
jgi:hypothetical protein